MVVTVDLPGSHDTYASLSRVVNASPHPVEVSGVSDKAVAGGVELIVQAGADVIDVYGDGADYKDGATAPAALVAKAIIAKLHH